MSEKNENITLLQFVGDGATVRLGEGRFRKDVIPGVVVGDPSQQRKAPLRRGFSF